MQKMGSRANFNFLGLSWTIVFIIMINFCVSITCTGLVAADRVVGATAVIAARAAVLVAAATGELALADGAVSVIAVAAAVAASVQTQLTAAVSMVKVISR